VRAIAIDAYGETPTLREVTTPEPKEREVRIRLHAAGVNPMDWRVRDGAPAQFDQEARFPLVLGLEGAGVIDAVGDDVDEWSEGDPVFGLFWPQVFEYGTFADYLVVPAGARMARKPDQLTFEQAAALPLAGGAAMFVQDWFDLKAGETLLIVGATGGVGSYSVQLAKQRGVRVLATSTVDDEAYIRELGADEVILFEREDVADAVAARTGGQIDAMLDVVNQQEELMRLAKLVRPGGRVASLIFGADIEALAERDIQAANILSHPVAEHFERLGDLAESGQLQIPIERIVPLEEAVDALALSESGRARGKIVINISAT
jgi:NADPH:quinone reductase